ncbi:MAG: ATP-binding cassette domain-containing protein [Chloroflexi bacterium]|nr:ATP-binding cassette domain-containing protein [Chloroflexota bacterium]
MATPLIAVEGVSFAAPGGTVARPVLRDATFEVAPGELVGLTGLPGSGKTTLLHIVAGLLQPDAGSVRLDDEDVWRGSTSRRRELRRTLISIVPAGGGLPPDRTLAEAMEQPVRLARVGRRDRGTRLAELVELAGLGADARRYPHEVATDVRWRAAVVRALALRPRIVLVDEPPAEAAEDVLRLLAPVTARQGAVVVATDDADVAALTGREIRLADGEVHGVGDEARVRLVGPPHASAGGATP